MTKNHYDGKIKKGEFKDRVYLDSLHYSLNATVFEDFKYQHCGVELWVTAIPKDFHALNNMDIDFNEHTELRYYAQYKFTVGKTALIEALRILNLFEGNYLYFVITIV